MFQHNNWSTQEIQKLKNCFLEGKRIKEMARDLNRTPTALNKALTRFGIRPKGVNKKARSLNWQHISKELLAKSELVQLRSEVQNQLIEESRWVEMRAVQDFLEKQGYVVKTIHHKGDDACDKRYMINCRIYSPLQLILKANRIRKDIKKPIFLVENVTW